MKNRLFAVLVVMFAVSAHVGCQDSSRATAAEYGKKNRGDAENNVAALRAAGHPVPPVDQWWIEHPDAETLTQSLRAPYRQDERICVRRLWFPVQILPGENVDDALMQRIVKNPKGPQQLALASHYLAALGEETQAEELMAEARAEFWIDPWQASIYCYSRVAKSMAAVLALDWIEWQNAEEFERAFLRVTQMLGKELELTEQGGRKFSDDGYWNATHPIYSAYFLQQLLALAAYGIHPEGASHQWAEQFIAEMCRPENTVNPTAYSTFEFANVLSLLSRRGGGREYGQSERHTGLGGYEDSFLSGAVFQLGAVDSATDYKFNLIKRNLYTRTRHIGLLFEQDGLVHDPEMDPNPNAALRIFAKWYRDEPEIGGAYQYFVEDQAERANFLEFQALAGPAPQSVAPTSESRAERVGSRWHYLENPADPESTFRMWITNRDIENFRISPDERCLFFASGQVGLVNGHANRTYSIDALSNGVQLSKREASGDPHVGDPSFWPILSSHHPYWSASQAKTAEQVLKDPFFLVGADGPVEHDGTWNWSRDYTDLMTRENKSEIVGDVGRAVAEYRITPGEKKMQIIDTIQAGPEVYVGWHFSTTHELQLVENGFDFGDESDQIQVRIEGLDGTKLEPTVRQEWQQDGYTLPLDWHNMVGGHKRVTENIGYTPTEHRDEFKVRVTIQAITKD
ncbi:hypothetical protein [Allorhodopirellula heiligendammensis]|uniref:Heparinase II/III-like protein n=1 Tax=Allorhodopirellula heiligendammensis TaxID=2714739 RepID=A0A5C6C5S8_9BACT|nr:hypothetical protein [Allorhodopirellula heiligendammensis]TWU19990.1 hypothetical protein Poly21_21690 [Allorhodopirellula heiligendammensis]